MEADTRKVLIIDDTPEDRVTVRRFLAKETDWRYEFVEAETGSQALARFEAEPFDCVLLDYVLPDTFGVDLLPRLVGAATTDDVPAVPVVMLTGTGNSSVAVTAMKRGAQDYLIKGRFTAVELQRAVNNAIDRVALLRERNQMMAALHASEERLHLAIEGAQIGTFDWDIASGAVQWSRNLESKMALPPGGFDGTLSAFYELVHPDDRDRVAARVSEALQIGNYETEFRMIKGDGTVRWVLTKARVTFDQAHQPLRMVGVDIDITDRKQAELDRAELLEKESAARAEAEAANRAKDEFLALVSHELRNPLSLMLGWSRTLRRHADPQVIKVVEIIERAAQNQQQLIEDLLDAARMMTGKLRLDTRPLDIASVIRSAVDVMRPAATAKQITLQSIDELAGEQITGDPDRLQQVVWNLLSNAVKFTPAGGQITVQLERRPPHVCLTISDTGKGIATDLLPHVFARFRQATDAGSAHRYGGLGLGLALVKQLVELHGGTVSAHSAGIGEGAKFSVWLPLRAVRGETSTGQQVGIIDSQADTLQLPSEFSLEGIRILVVDDEEDARQVITDTLTHGGADVRTADSAQAAMEMLMDKGWRPALLVCDIGMPDEDGYSFMRRVRQLSPEEGGALPAIALTAYNQRQDRMRALQASFQTHLAKPVEPLELALTAASLLGR